MSRRPTVSRMGLLRWSYVVWSPDGCDMIYGESRTQRGARRQVRRLAVWGNP